VLWRAYWGTNWEPDGNHKELERNVVGTHWEPRKNEKKSSPTSPN